MSYFYYQGGKQSYSDYIRDRSSQSHFISSIHLERDEIALEVFLSLRNRIVSVEALDRLLGRTSPASNPENEILLFKIDKEANAGLRLRITFDQRLGELISHLEAMNRSFDQLKKDTGSVTEEAILKGFDSAREHFQKKRYAKCLDSLGQTLRNTKNENVSAHRWRLYALKGCLELGFVGCDVSLVDIEAAESSFLKAAEGAEPDHPQEVSALSLAAAWASYCLGRMEEAALYVSKALDLRPEASECLYLTAKIKMAMGESAESFSFLKKAIEKDRFFALRAAGDGDFQGAQTSSFFDRLLHVKKEAAQDLISQAEETLKLSDEHLHEIFENWDASLSSIKASFSETDAEIKNLTEASLKVQSIFSEIREKVQAQLDSISRSKKVLGYGSYYDFRDAAKMAESVHTQIRTNQPSEKGLFQAEMKMILEQISERVSNLKALYRGGQKVLSDPRFSKVESILQNLTLNVTKKKTGAIVSVQRLSESVDALVLSKTLVDEYFLKIDKEVTKIRRKNIILKSTLWCGLIGFFLGMLYERSLSFGLKATVIGAGLGLLVGIRKWFSEKQEKPVKQNAGQSV